MGSIKVVNLAKEKRKVSLISFCRSNFLDSVWRSLGLSAFKILS